MQTVTIDRLGHRGDGVATTEAGPVYVPRALPGEVVAGEVSAGRMDAPRIVTPSDRRVAASCRHYRACGGCALMHARDDFVADWKQDVVRAALAAHGLSAPFRAPAVSPPRSRRRATLSARRFKSGAVAGFHARASASIAGVPECHVLTDTLRGILPTLSALAAMGCARKGEIAFAVTDTETGIDVAATGGKPADARLAADLAAAVSAADVAQLTWNGDTIARAVPPRVTFGPAQVVLPPGAFLQATAHGEAALVAAVTEAVGDARRIADLFAGCGTFALPMATGAAVAAFDGSDALTDALAAGWRGATGLKPVTAMTRDLFRAPLATAELAAFDAVVIDPPRAGARAQAEALAASTVARIASVSCDPASFARDAAILVAGGYRLDWLQVVDQFRWSPHVEIVAQFTRSLA